MRALGAKGTEVFSAKLTIWKQLATTFQYLGTAPNQHRDGFSLHNHCLCRVDVWSRTSHARLTPDACTQPDWDAAVEQFSLLFFLRLLSDKRGAEISQNLHQIVELISRIEGLLQSWSSTPLQVTSVFAGIFQIFVVCWSKGWMVNKQVDIVKRHCQSAVDMNLERPD